MHLYAALSLAPANLPMSPSIKSRLLATQSDERLMVLVREGHEAAFEALVHRYRKPLLRYCRSLCLCEAHAEEALQQALLNAWIALRRGAEVRELRPWLYRVAHNASVNAMRGDRLRRVEPLGEDHEQIVARRGGPSSLDELLALRDALAGMAALPRMQREAIVRTTVAGHSHEEVASALGITEGAVRGLLYRARASLREGLSAITPGSLLAWVASAGATGSSSGERMAELAAGGGAAGLGVAIKGGIVAITAGVAITGAVMAHGDASHAGRRPGFEVTHARTPHGTGRETVASAHAQGAVRVAPRGLRTARAESGGHIRARDSFHADGERADHEAAPHPDGADAQQSGSGDSSPVPVNLGGDGGRTGEGGENEREATSHDREQAHQKATQSTQGETSTAPTSSGWEQSYVQQWEDGSQAGSQSSGSGQEGGEGPKAGKDG